MHEYGTLKNDPKFLWRESAFWISVDRDATVHLQLRTFTYLKKKLNSISGHYMVFSGTHEILYLSLW